MRRSTRAAMFVLAAALAGVLAGATAVAKVPPPPPGALTFTPDSYDFGSVAVGSSATHDFTLSYSGAGSTGKITVALAPKGSAKHPGPFTISASTCASRTGLTSQTPCTVTVNYAPLAQDASDSGTLKATAGKLTTNLVALSGVSPHANTPPTAENQSVTAVKNTDKTITLRGHDEDGDDLTFTIVKSPNGSLGTLGTPFCTGSPETGSTCTVQVTYTPTTDSTAADSFTFKTNDGKVDSSSDGTVSITFNTPPSVDSQTVVAQGNSQLTIHLTGSDPDGDVINFAIVNQPSNGTLNTDDIQTTRDCTGTKPNNCSATVYYTRTSGDSDSFTFKTNDGAVDSASATVTITINHPPTAEATTAEVDAGDSITITLTAHDPDGDTPLSFQIAAGPAPQLGSPGTITTLPCTEGTPSTCTATVVYTADSYVYGEDSFGFYVSDAGADSADATVSVTVNKINHAPTADPQTVDTVNENDTDFLITLTGSDDDNDTLTFAATQPSHGTLDTGTVADGAVYYTPDAGYDGPDSFTFTANDGTVDSAAATVSITVSKVNQQPTADGQTDLTVTHRPSDTLTIVLSGYDPDGQDLTFAIVGDGPDYGTLSAIATPSCAAGICTADVTYTPEGSNIGSDDFTFSVNDGELESEAATIGITLTNTPPYANPPDFDPVEVAMNSTVGVDITLSGGDADEDAITFYIDGPGHGQLSNTLPGCSSNPSLRSLASAAGACSVQVTYTPDTGYFGTDSFTFYTYDGWNDSATTETVSISVVAPEPGLLIDSPWAFSNDNDPITFTVSMDAPSASDVSFEWAANDLLESKDAAVWGTTCDGSADYTSAEKTGEGTILAGETSTTIVFGTCNNGPANGDPITTPTYFMVTISNASGATITTDTGTGEIRIS